MTTPTAEPRSTKIAWICAVLTAWLGAAILFNAGAGINWPIWVTAASLSLVAARFVSIGRVEKPLLVLVTWAIVLSIGFSSTANEFIHFLVVLADAMLLGLATITLGAENWDELSAKLLVAVPFLAPIRVVGSTAKEAANAPRSISSPRARALVKGTALSLPLILILVTLLASADPVIRWSTDRIAAWLPDWTFPPRVLFFLFLLTLTLGANALALKQLSAKFPAYPSIEGRVSVGVTEQRMMLWSAAVVLWLFVALQISYFIHPPPAALGTGVTFADFARRGFGELSFAATIVGAMIIALEYARPANTTDHDRLVLRRLEIALLIALELVLISAFRRVLLYEDAYGFTEDRVFAQAYMIGMALAVAALGWEIVRGKISVAFGRRVAEIALGVFTILVFWNYEAWIVNKNVDRIASGEKFHAGYLTRLSLDATPTLIRRLPEIPLPQRDTVTSGLACKRRPAAGSWFEFNPRVDAAVEALNQWNAPPCIRTPIRFVPDRALPSS
ncbi:MAG TPA: DUF4173 domain-containing protein [Gemmatimonadaceae bacterium]|nr:DUF4173 domain-containing protein [Gemmatimonadaceae bacterium]